MRLTAGEFIRRFMQHVLPAEFVRIRHYGLFANGRKQAKLARCRALLAAVTTAEQLMTAARDDGKRVEPLPEEQFQRCAACGLGQMVRRAELPPGCGPPSWEVRRAA